MTVELEYQWTLRILLYSSKEQWPHAIVDDLIVHGAPPLLCEDRFKVMREFHEVLFITK